MALKPVSLLLLLDLTLFLHGVTSLCNVTCSTDYSVSLNCSCSGCAPTHSVLLRVTCSDEEYEVQGVCEVKPPQSWCVMYPEMLDNVASIGTMCTARVSQQGDEVIMDSSELPTWALSDVVKPLPPFDIQVKNGEGFCNITWDHDNKEDCLAYLVRVRESKDLSKDPVYSLSVEQKHILIDHKKLQPHVNYTGDVKVKLCPGNLYEGPWSEWSSTAEWRTRGKAEIEGTNWCVLYVSMSIISVLGFLGLMSRLRKPFRCMQKKIQLITFVPKPDAFFSSLDQIYGGNFKEWVKPVFSEYDYLQMKREKQHDVLLLNSEKQSYREDELKHGGHFLHMPQPHSNSLLFLQDGSGSTGPGHSSGHISIHTVTLCGEEEFEEEVVSESTDNTFRSYQDGPSLGSSGDDNREEACYDVEEPQVSRLDSGVSPHHENQISNDLSEENKSFQSHAQLIEPEMVSLDSFASNEQSEDGYPHVDLDTIDSGFGECSSPGVSGSNRAEQTHSDPFHEHVVLNSNYVKQWMACGTIQEHASHSESELQQTQ